MEQNLPIFTVPTRKGAHAPRRDVTDALINAVRALPVDYGHLMLLPTTRKLARAMGNTSDHSLNEAILRAGFATQRDFYSYAHGGAPVTRLNLNGQFLVVQAGDLPPEPPVQFTFVHASPPQTASAAAALAHEVINSFNGDLDAAQALGHALLRLATPPNS